LCPVGLRRGKATPQTEEKETTISEKEVGRAIKDYDEAIRLNPQDAKAYHNRGLTYCRDLGEFERGIEDFDEAIRLNP